MLRPILAGLGLAALIVIAPGHPSLADSRVPYTVEIENATAKVGEPTVGARDRHPAGRDKTDQRLSPPSHRPFRVSKTTA